MQEQMFLNKRKSKIRIKGLAKRPRLVKLHKIILEYKMKEKRMADAEAMQKEKGDTYNMKVNFSNNQEYITSGEKDEITY